MKRQYVKTSNHQRFMAGIAAVENRGSPEACICLLTGAPGTGKSTTVDHWAAHADAIYLEGMPGMTLSFVRDYLADQTGVPKGAKFAEYKAMVAHFTRSGQPIILDEAQHGLANKAECIEYLRRIAEAAKVILVLVCHTSERFRFAEDRLAHIATRISDAPVLLPASLEDCATYLNDLCEVKVDGAIVKQVFEASRGRYRLMANAGRTLELIAGKLGKTDLSGPDVKGISLCEDAMKALKKERRQ
jgi:hypothetical protein